MSRFNVLANTCFVDLAFMVQREGLILHIESLVLTRQYRFTVLRFTRESMYSVGRVLPYEEVHADDIEGKVRYLVYLMKGHITNGFTCFESITEEGVFQAVTPCN